MRSCRPVNSRQREEKKRGDVIKEVRGRAGQWLLMTRLEMEEFRKDRSELAGDREEGGEDTGKSLLLSVAICCVVYMLLVALAVFLLQLSCEVWGLVFGAVAPVSSLVHYCHHLGFSFEKIPNIVQKVSW